MDSKELFKKILMEETVYSDEIDIDGIKVRFRLLNSKDFYEVYEGIGDLNNTKDLLILNSNRLAVALYEIDGKKFDDLVREKYGEVSFNMKRKFVDSMKINFRSALIKAYIKFEDSYNNISEGDKKNF